MTKLAAWNRNEIPKHWHGSGAWDTNPSGRDVGCQPIQSNTWWLISFIASNFDLVTIYWAATMCQALCYTVLHTISYLILPSTWWEKCCSHPESKERFDINDTSVQWVFSSSSKGTNFIHHQKMSMKPSAMVSLLSLWSCYKRIYESTYVFEVV